MAVVGAFFGSYGEKGRGDCVKMPLFGKPDEAENRFKDAKSYSDPWKSEFDLDRAIRLLEEAVMLKPDRKKYRSMLNEMLEIKAAGDTEVARVEATKIMSSTSQYPMPKDVYLFQLSKLKAEGGGRVTFRHQGEKRIWVQVVFDEETEETLVQFTYPHDEDPNQLVPKLGVSFPTDYALVDWERQTSAVFAGPRCPHLELADTIDAVFTKVQGAPPNYVVEGRIHNESDFVESVSNGRVALAVLNMVWKRMEEGH